MWESEWASGGRKDEKKMKSLNEKVRQQGQGFVLKQGKSSQDEKLSFIRIGMAIESIE